MQQTRSASQTPPASPTTPTFKKTSSQVNLSRAGSKVNMKKSHSHVTLSRNGSTTKLGNKAKSEKAQTKTSLRKKGTNDASVNGTAGFEVGDGGDDDDEEEEGEEWTEYSSSPYTTRHNSANPSRPKTPLTRDPPPLSDDTRDEETERLLEDFQRSSPGKSSRSHLGEDPSSVRQSNGTRKTSHFSHPPDAEAVTNRLLGRNRPQTPVAKTSTISASVTPPVVMDSLSTNQSTTTSTSIKEPSMPSDGISRFLDRNSADSTGVTPSSVSYLQSNLAHSQSNKRAKSRKDSSGTTSPPREQHAHKSLSKTTDSRRIKSAANLTHSRLLPNGTPPSDYVDQSAFHSSNGSVPAPSTSQYKSSKPFSGPSPFESARSADPSAGKSLTQLKLDLQRLSTQRAEHPSSHAPNNPLLSQAGAVGGYGGMLNLAGLGSGDADMAVRVTRQWETSRMEVAGVKRFWPEVVRGRIIRQERKGPEKSQRGERHKGRPATPDDLQVTAAGNRSQTRHHQEHQQLTHTSETTLSSGIEGRGRVRFEVGGRSFEEANGSGLTGGTGSTDTEEDPTMTEEEIDGLLRRMWVGGEVLSGAD